MKFYNMDIEDVYLIEPERFHDDRGFFMRTFCRKEFMMHGLVSDFEQCNVSFNQRKGTLRGMHFQETPFGEEKLVRCTLGRIYDVVLDLRPESPTYKQWRSVELTRENSVMLYIPQGCAHGFQTLEDEVEVVYQMSKPFVPEAARGVRWNDPAFKIHWPLPVTVISKKDREYPLLESKKLFPVPHIV